MEHLIRLIYGERLLPAELSTLALVALVKMADMYDVKTVTTATVSYIQASMNVEMAEALLQVQPPLDWASNMVGDFLGTRFSDIEASVANAEFLRLSGKALGLLLDSCKLKVISENSVLQAL